MVLKKMTNKTLETYFTLPYTIKLTSGEDGVRFASIPLLKGYMIQSDSQEEALAMLNKAKELWLKTALEESIPIPTLTGVMSS